MQLELPADLDLTAAQRDRIDKIAELLSIAEHDVSVSLAPDLPSGWVSVTMGRDKGRPKTFDIDPDGIPAR